MTRSHDRDGAHAADSDVSAPSPSDDSTSQSPVTLSPDRPLPPLPDGGLAASMPDWLRDAPEAAVAEAPETAGSPPNPDPEAGARSRAPVTASDDGDLRDPTTYLTPDDLPTWIHQLVAQERSTDAAETAPLAADQFAPEAVASAVARPTDDAPVSLPPLPAATAAGDSLLTRTQLGSAPAAVEEPTTAEPRAAVSASVAAAPPLAHRETPHRATTAPNRSLLPYVAAALLLAIAVIFYLVSNGMLS